MTTQTPQIYPIHSQSFQEIRQEGYLYIDKTDFIYKMTHPLKRFVFLSRPRRFGKSLLVSTFKAYFEGKKDLFKGLKIENLEKEWKEYPVLHIDLSTVKDIESKDDLLSKLNSKLLEYESIYGRNEAEKRPSHRLGGIIKRAFQQTGKQVVVLIDEYDAPILDTLNKDILEAVRGVMSNFYCVLKSSVSYLKFVFLTGITKFSLSDHITGGLNNIMNISMNEDYASICGITEEEMLTQLKPDIENLAKENGLTYGETIERLKSEYDGYHFTWPSPDIYNPYSLLNALSSKEIKDYWFSSSVPPSLIEILKKFDVMPNNIGEMYAFESWFNAPIETLTDELPLLYHAGYLTIKGYSNDEVQEYFLDIPNKEVRVGLSDCLLPIK